MHSPGCGAPYPLCSPSLSFCTRCSCVPGVFWGADLWLRPSKQMSTIQNLRKSFVRNWKPVFSLVGDALSGAEFAPFPSPLPLASGGDGPVRRQLALLALLWNCSVGWGLAHPQLEAGGRGEGKGANSAPETASPTKLKTGFQFLTKDLLRFWLVDIRQEGRS